MRTVTRALRKLGLGNAASRLLSPLAADHAPLPSEEEARAMLTALRPDAGSSALRAQSLPEAAPRRDVDVIIPVYNTAAYLQACLDSVFTQQTRYAFHVIAVDDGSTDGSAAILDACTDPHLTVIHQENRGLAGARNRGLLSTFARYVYFLDADDLLCPGCLDALVSCAEAHAAEIVEGAFRTADPDGRPLDLSSHAPGPLPRGQASFGFACGKLFSRACFSQIAFPEGYLFEDSIMAQLIFPLARAHAGALYGVEAETFLYRQNSGGIVRSSLSNAKSLDSLWVTLSLYRDRQALGLENDQPYYEYLLNMLPLTWRRTEALGEEVSRAVFVLQRSFLLGAISDFSTERRAFRMLEQAVRDGDYGRYRLFCSLH